jgi:hypothetical protein
MRSASYRAVVLVVVALMAGCSPGRKSPAGFHLPDGDAAAGRAAFVQLKCHACHTVAGEALPAPIADPPVALMLGGDVPSQRTDGALITAIVDPSHSVSVHYRQQPIRAGELSRMGDYSDAMTVRQLIDIVAFLHARYRVVPPQLPVM